MNKTILVHAAACTLVEPCGWVVSTSTGERCFPCQNLSAEPTVCPRMNPTDYLQVQAVDDVVALVHSHPDGLPFLSDVDHRLQIQSGLPWWLVCDDRIYKFRCMPFLTGRAFEYGVTDCYTLSRDTYHLVDIEMPDFARKEDWRKQGDNLCLDNLEATGLYRVNVAEVRPEGILICCFSSSAANHTAIYCGDGELLHHIPDQPNKRERYAGKWQRRTHSIWRCRAWYESTFTGIYNDLDAASVSV